jgi:hypothetical protein
MLTKQFIRKPLFGTVQFSKKENFIKNKMKFKEYLIKNNQKNYNKIITRKIHSNSNLLPNSCFGGGKDPFNYKNIIITLFGIWLYRNSSEPGNGNGNKENKFSFMK